MATVYLARDLKHLRPVAVKVLHPELAAGLGAERFLREIRIEAGLQHPHILPLHDSGVAAGFLYYVMPYVAGESLRQRLTREGAARRGRTPYCRGRRRCPGGRARNGVVHRDIKPENILLSGAHALVADFGIAKAIEIAGGREADRDGLGDGNPGLHESGAGCRGRQSMAGATSTGWPVCSTRCWRASRRSAGPRRGRSWRGIRWTRSLASGPSAARYPRRSMTRFDGAGQSPRRSVRDRGGVQSGADLAELGHETEGPARPARIIRWARPSGQWSAGGSSRGVARIPFGVDRRSFRRPRASRCSRFAPSVADTALTRLGRDLVFTVSANLDDVGEVRTVDAHTILAQSANPTSWCLAPRRRRPGSPLRCGQRGAREHCPAGSAAGSLGLRALYQRQPDADCPGLGNGLPRFRSRVERFDHPSPAAAHLAARRAAHAEPGCGPQDSLRAGAPGVPGRGTGPGRKPMGGCGRGVCECDLGRLDLLAALLALCVQPRVLGGSGHR